ncbi:Uncharacterised protein [Mycobacterium tuberculosis]|nr:Uncharacterised protein [Mycobacterium tuberculosis]
MMRSSCPTERSSVNIHTPNAVPATPPHNSTRDRAGSIARLRQ